MARAHLDGGVPTFLPIAELRMLSSNTTMWAWSAGLCEDWVELQ
jgi:hypothetical protein